MPLYKGARLKIERADHHISDAELRINCLRKRLICTANVEADTGCEFVKCDFASVEDRNSFDYLPAIIGDAIHNLKCALDHAWLETMTRLVPLRDWERTKFPVHLTANDLESALRTLEIDKTAPNFFNLIMGEIKPHEGGDFAIRTVHELDIRDKHRLLIPVAHYYSIGDIYVEDQYGTVHRRDSWGTGEIPGYIKLVRGLHIKDPGSAACEVMFEYGDFGRQTRTVETLRLYSQHILRAAKLLEEFEES